jgi:hypothetical protein
MNIKIIPIILMLLIPKSTNAMDWNMENRHALLADIVAAIREQGIDFVGTGNDIPHFIAQIDSEFSAAYMFEPTMTIKSQRAKFAQIAKLIRIKSGKSDKLRPSDMPAAIRAIPRSSKTPTPPKLPPDGYTLRAEWSDDYSLIERVSIWTNGGMGITSWAGSGRDFKNPDGYGARFDIYQRGDSADFIIRFRAYIMTLLPSYSVRSTRMVWTDMDAFKKLIAEYYPNATGFQVNDIRAYIDPQQSASNWTFNNYTRIADVRNVRQYPTPNDLFGMQKMNADSIEITAAYQGRFSPIWGNSTTLGAMIFITAF